MKKIILVVVSITAVAMFANMALAADVLLSPTSVNTQNGQVFAVTITINPQSEKIYTTKAELKYPSDIFEMRSFSFAPNWMPLSQPGYDVVDNQNGVLVKTGGYTGGVSVPVVLGTATFFAKKAGNGTVSVGSGSLVLNANGQNVVSDFGSSVSIKVSTPPPAPVSTPKPTSKPVIQQPEVVEVEKVVAEENKDDQTATAITAEGFNTQWFLIVTFLVLASFATGVFVGQKKRFNLGSIK